MKALKLRIPIIILLINFSSSVFAQEAKAVRKLSLTVSDLEEAVSFYTGLLDFKQESTFELSGKEIQRLYGLQDSNLNIRVATLSLGNENIELLEFDTNEQGRPIPIDSRSNDLWFQHIAIVVSDMDKAYQKVYEAGVTHVSTAPQTLPDYIPAAAGISAFYFRDPDGHNLELIYFPQGKGNPRWQKNTDQLFLGIDHSAIGIERTDQSLKFYKDLIGLKFGGNSENYGSEQEHLNQVFGARLLITGLHAQEGPGVEFLDYIAPPGGRPYPVDSKPQDLWYWQISIQVSEIEAAYHSAQKANYSILSNGIASISHPELGEHKAFIMRGPDGHAVYLFE